MYKKSYDVDPFYAKSKYIIDNEEVARIKVYLQSDTGNRFQKFSFSKIKYKIYKTFFHVFFIFDGFREERLWTKRKD